MYGIFRGLSQVSGYSATGIFDAGKLQVQSILRLLTKRNEFNETVNCEADNNLHDIDVANTRIITGVTVIVAE